MEKRKSSLDETVEKFETHPDLIIGTYKDLLEEQTDHESSLAEDDLEEIKQDLFIDNSKIQTLNKKAIIVKLVIAFLFFLVVAMNEHFIALAPQLPIELKDHLHILTASANEYFAQNPGFRQLILNASALVEDLSLVAMCFGWILTGKNWKPFIALFAFYSAKLMCTCTFTIKAPEGYLWDDLAYPSITFSNNKKSWNFFFSGLIGLNIICSSYLKEYTSKIMQALSYLSMLNTVIQSFFFVFIRSNYFIDIISSIILALCFVFLSDSLNKYASHIYSLLDGADHVGKDELAMRKQKLN